jgi:hypothetical protein
MEDDESKTNWTERILIFLLCFAAAVRVFIYSAAFPFFSSVDEDLHLDLITQYSHGHLPRAFKPLKDETLNWIVPYASPEFLFPPDQFPNSKFPAPLWKQTGRNVGAEIAATRTAWSSEINFEASQPPLYYVLSGLWWSVGRHIGFVGIGSLYWIRFLNVLLIALVVWLGYVAARIIAPDRVEMRIGVPMLLAFIPQNVFYAINNDALSPVFCGVLFLCVLQWLRTNAPSLLLGALTGLAIAAAYLTKLSNLPFIAVALVAIFAKLCRRGRQIPRGTLIAFAALVICCAIPIGSWIVWTKSQFGDLTGSAMKISLLGWAQKPFASWWQHPIFTVRGLWIFWSDLIVSFWRGEVTWHGRRLSCRVADGVYTISSLVLLGVTIAGLRKRTGFSVFQRQAIAAAILVFVAGVVFLALLSIQFDFGDATYPSRAHPYFTSGRLLSGALIPFALWYVYGIAFLLRRAQSAVLPIAIIGGVVAFIAASEIAANHIVFASEHNWFHR